MKRLKYATMKQRRRRRRRNRRANRVRRPRTYRRRSSGLKFGSRGYHSREE